jgi:hypothetical protein
MGQVQAEMKRKKNKSQVEDKDSPGAVSARRSITTTGLTMRGSETPCPLLSFQSTRLADKANRLRWRNTPAVSEARCKRNIPCPDPRVMNGANLE